MADTTKVTAEELQSLQDVQKRSNLLIQELGTIALQRLNLDQREESAEKFLAETQQLEAQLSKMLEEKYGKVTVDTVTGDIAPIA